MVDNETIQRWIFRYAVMIEVREPNNPTVYIGIEKCTTLRLKSVPL